MTRQRTKAKGATNAKGATKKSERSPYLVCPDEDCLGKKIVKLAISAKTTVWYCERCDEGWRASGRRFDVSPYIYDDDDVC